MPAVLAGEVPRRRNGRVHAEHDSYFAERRDLLVIKEPGPEVHRVHRNIEHDAQQAVIYLSHGSILPYRHTPSRDSACHASIRPDLNDGNRLVTSAGVSSRRCLRAVAVIGLPPW